MPDRNPHDILRDVKHAIRNRYAWPGGYTLHVLMQDGETMCTDCAMAEWRDVVYETLHPYPRGGWRWAAAAVFVHWEGPPDTCCNCGRELPSEYGDPDAWRDE